MNKKLFGSLAATAVAGLIASSAITTVAKADTVKCDQSNACKGKGACKGADNACKGKNSCKNHVFDAKNDKACKKAHGKAEAAAAAPAGGDAAPAGEAK